MARQLERARTESGAARPHRANRDHARRIEFARTDGKAPSPWKKGTRSMSNGAVVSPPTGRPLARAYEHLTAGRVAEAAGAYRAVLQLDAGEPQAHAGLGHCAFVRGQPREAFDHFVRAAGLWREREDAIAALGCYTHAVASDPSQLDVHVDIAELEAELGHVDAARQRLEGLAENYLATGRQDDAVAILEFVNQWGDAGAEAPDEAIEQAEEPAAVPEVIRDVEGTMVFSTFLLMPDGRPFIPPSATGAQPHVVADGGGVDLDVDLDVDLAFDALTDDESDATASRPTPLEAAAEPDDALVSAHDLGDIELPPDLFGGEGVEEREPTAVRPIPVAAMPPRRSAPPSRDAHGRTLAERLRTTRAQAAAPTAPHPTTRPLAVAGSRKPTAAAKPTASAGSTAAAKPTASAKPSTPAKPTASVKPTAPAPRPATATAPRPISTAPITTRTAAAAVTTRTAAAAVTTRTAAAAVTTRTAAAAVTTRTAAARSTAASMPGRPTAVGKPPASGRAAPMQAAAASAASRSATAGRPTSAAPQPRDRGETQPAARAPASRQEHTQPRATLPTRPGAAPRSAAARATGTVAKPTTADPKTASPSRAGEPATPATRPSSTASASRSATAKPTASAKPTAPAKSTAPAKPTASAKPTAPAKPTARPGAAKPGEPSTAAPTRSDGRRGAEAGTRAMASRTRPPAPGVPTPVAPGHTLPLVIPAPGSAEELDDSRTVVYRGGD